MAIALEARLPSFSQVTAYVAIAHWTYDPWPVGHHQAGLLEGLSTGQDKCRCDWIKSGEMT